MSRWPFSLYDDAAEKIDRRYGWDKLPLPVAMLVLIGLRNILRAKNLVRHRPRAARQAGHLGSPELPDRAHARRHLQQPRRPADGQPQQPVRPQRPARVHRAREGSAGAEPAPISRELLTRKEFIPATTLNLLAGAWIQFEVHDWFSHGKNEAENPWKVPLEDDDPWPQHPMEIQRTRRDPSADPDGPPTFVTDDTHWWDASQIYGNDPAFAAALRTGEHGKLKIDDRGLIPQEIEAHVDLVGRRRQLLGRPRAAALAVHARAQRRLRPPARDASGAVRRRSSTTRRGSSSRR